MKKQDESVPKPQSHPDSDDDEQHGENEDEMDIMSMLHKTKLKIIENDFALREKGLKLKEFVTVMLKHLEFEKEDDLPPADKLAVRQFNEDQEIKKKRSDVKQQIKKKITVSLIDLFKEIDVNGDASMEWEEFSNHIIELGLLRKDRTFRNVIKNYYPSELVFDKEKHETDIEKIYYFDQIRQMIVLEKDSPKFKVYNASNCDLLCEVNAHKGAILAAEILPEQNLIATSSNDLTINFWDTTSFNLKQILSTPEIQLVVRNAQWNSSSNLLYTGGSDAIIHIYDSNTLKEKATLSGWNPFFKKDIQQYGHAGPIGDILPIKFQSTLVTAALDGKICLWDVPTHSFKKELQGHEKGVYSLDWADWTKMHQCLISAGLDHEAYVWNTYVKEKIFALRGHNHPLIGVKWLPDSPQVVTADISGMVKIWDVRNFENKQSFTCTLDELNAFSISYKNTKKRIIVGTRHLNFYEYDEPKDQLLTDEKMCLKILYNSVMLCFITLHPDSVKVWDAKNGKLISVHRELSHAELTVCILDNRQRKLFVGDADGRIFTVNIKNGAKMKKFQRHHKMITDLIYWTSSSVDGSDKDKDIRRIVSISRENMVNIHDEDSADPHKSVRYQMRQHQKSCNALSMKKGTDLIASCSDDGLVVITNLNTYRQEVLWRREIWEIKKVLFLDNYDCLCACDSDGNVMFFAIGNSKIKNKLVLTMEYKTLSATNHLEKFPVSCLAFYTKECLLLLGDEFGNVAVWNIVELLARIEDFTNEKSKERKGFLSESRKSATVLLSKRKEKDVLFATEPEPPSKSPQKQSENINLLNGEEDFSKIFFKEMITFETPLKNEHNDGITWIEIIEDYNSFATSSFDCCCHIWSFDEWNISERKEWKKIGSLILGTDQSTMNVILKVDQKKINEAAELEADRLLEKLAKKPYEVMFSKEEQTEENNEKKKKNTSQTTKSQKVLDELQNENAKSDKPEKINKKPITPEIDKVKTKEKILERAKLIQEKHQELKKFDWRSKDTNPEFDNRLFGSEMAEELFQDDDEEDNDYNILYDLNDYNKNSQPAAGFTSKSAFKTKLFSKGRLKVKLK